eukprot:scaffold2936_cov113-Cylindrotheca_fusiformis.AAC.2
MYKLLIFTLMVVVMVTVSMQLIRVALLSPAITSSFDFHHHLNQPSSANSNERNTTDLKSNIISTNTDLVYDDYQPYNRMDEVGPNVLETKTHYFQSLPTEYRFPSDVTLSNLSDYFEKTQLSRRKRYYWEYNPSFVPLPPSQVPMHLLKNNNSSHQEEDHYYLGVYRISNQQGCFTLSQTRPNGTKVNLGTEGPIELMGFAIVNTSLDIVAESILVMIGRDFRLFRHGDSIYLSREAGFRQLWLMRPQQQIGTIRLQAFLNNNNDKNKNDFSVYIGRRNYCCYSQYCKGKNFNYFADHHGRLMVDSRSMLPHIVEGIDMSEPKIRECHSKTFYPPLTESNYTNATNTNLTAANTNSSYYPLYVTRSIPKERFSTTDELYFAEHNVRKLPYTEERGTACCIRIPNPLQKTNTTTAAAASSDYLLVGVSHTKISKWQDGLLKQRNVSFTLRQYNSRFYAFEPSPPYRILAQSGRFCMPYPPEDGENPSMPWIRNIPFVIGGTNYSCPYITFVMGMIESIDDPDNTILMTYGMNDCGAQVAKVQKTEISRMLFA